MLSATLDQMARGGIYDQLGGGFHRYATDREWKVPHFEKMLYDNGFLLELYAREHARTGDPQAARIVRETAGWLAREMTSPEGAFWSAIDAETHGHEGAYYVWTRDELFETLGQEDAAFLAPILGFDVAAFFEGDHYVLHLPDRIEQAAARRKLLAARFRRERPLTDDKILADWNGTVICGLAVAGQVLGDASLIDRAAAAARFVLDRMRTPDGVLLHAWRQGHGKIAAYLEDYAFLVRGLLALHKAQGDDRWLRAAVELTEEQIRRLRDNQGGQGGFFGAAESPDLLFRSKDVFDGAMPAANAVAILNLLELADRTGDGVWKTEARAALQAFAPMVQTYPDGARMMSIAARRYHKMDVEADEGMTAHAAWERTAGASGVDKLTHAAEGLVKVRLDEMQEAGDGWKRFQMTLEVAPGWHIQANPASEEYLVPTEVVAEGGAEVRGLRYPEGEPIPAGFAGGRPLAVYSGRVEIVGETRGGGRLVVRFQPCDDTRCLPPIEHPVTA
jgi:uncharacterized protein YyaL (SSP411 family)